MEILIVVIAIVVLAAGAVASAGAFGGMATEPVRDTYAPELPGDRPVEADDLHAVRFGVSARGYDMEQVDAVMARMAAQLRERGVDAGVAGEPEQLIDEPVEAKTARPATRRTQQDPAARARAWRGRDVDPEAEADEWRPRD